MIIIIDERDEIIASNISNDWFLDVIAPLREFPIGKHFDETGSRIQDGAPAPSVLVEAGASTYA